MMNAYPCYAKRKYEILDGIWEFCFLGESEDADSVVLELISYDDYMPVPGVFDATPKYAGKRGIALYRRKVDVSPDSRLKLKLGGVGFWCRVFWDSKIVGSVDLPYSGVELEFPSSEKEEHELVILIDNRYDFKRTPLIHQYYDFYGYGGIYRSVELHQLPECSFDRVSVTTLDISSGLLSIDIAMTGKVPAEIAFEVRFDRGESKSFTGTPNNGHIKLNLNVPYFNLWSPEKPNLHTVTVSTADDEITERFGIRSISACKGQIYLNGEVQKLLGYCRHESHPEFGPVQPPPLLIEDLQYLKDLGCNFIRGVHYPQDQRFLDLCDQMGFFVWEESMGWGNREEHFADKGFCDAQIRQTRLMVRNSYNHPSIIIWGFLNEGPSNLESSRDLYTFLFSTVREEDSSRLVTYASFKGKSDLFFEMADIVSLNTYPGWYAWDLEKVRPLDEIIPSLENFIGYLDSGSLKDKPFIVSEIGAGAIYGWHDRLRAHWSEEYQADYLDIVCNHAVDNRRISGIAVWHFMDARTYASSYALSRPRTINDKGTLDEYRRPKLSYERVKLAFNKKKTGRMNNVLGV